MAKQTFTTGQVLTAANMTSLQDTAMGGGAATAKTASYVLVAADAGTTVAMNAAGATTITVNTGLFAAGDTVFIQNIGAGVCTITAGTATVNTAGALALPQYDAGILYFTSASAAIFYDYIQVGAVSPLTTKGDLYTFSTSDTRLPVGTNGHTLVADSAEATGLKWAAPAGGGGKVLQVVNAIHRTSKTIATTTPTDTDLTASITPTLNTSSILVLVNCNVNLGGQPSSVGGYTGKARLMRGATDISSGAGNGLELQLVGDKAANGNFNNSSFFSICYLDSPATTSSTTYKLQAFVTNTGDSARIIAQHDSSVSTIILMEIGA